MTKHNVKLLDPAGKVVAVATVTDKGTYFGGSVDLGATPPELRALFEAFDEIANGQMFSLLDEFHEKIDSLGIRASFADGREAAVYDLQVYPSTGDVSFRVARDAKLNGMADATTHDKAGGGARRKPAPPQQ
jgi:hypothetical protein